MAEDSVPGVSGSLSRKRASYALATVGLLACAVIAGLQARDDHVNGLSAVLLLSAVLAGVTVVQSRERSSVSAGFMVLTLAAAFLGPATCALCAVATEVVASRRLRTPVAAM